MNIHPQHLLAFLISGTLFDMELLYLKLVLAQSYGKHQNIAVRIFAVFSGKNATHILVYSVTDRQLKSWSSIMNKESYDAPTINRKADLDEDDLKRDEGYDAPTINRKGRQESSPSM